MNALKFRKARNKTVMFYNSWAKKLRMSEWNWSENGWMREREEIVYFFLRAFRMSDSVIKIFRSNTWYKIHFDIMTEMCCMILIVCVYGCIHNSTSTCITISTREFNIYERTSEQMNWIYMCTRTMYSTLINGKDGEWSACVLHTRTHTSCQARRLMHASLPRKKQKCAREAEMKIHSKFGTIFSYDIKLWMLIESFEILHCAKSFHYATMIMLPESSLHFRRYRRLVVLWFSAPPAPTNIIPSSVAFLPPVPTSHFIAFHLSLSPALFFPSRVARSLCVWRSLYSICLWSVCAWIVKDVHFRESLPKHLSAMKWNKSNFTTHFVKMKTVFTSFRSLSLDARFFLSFEEVIDNFLFHVFFRGLLRLSMSMFVRVHSIERKKRNANGNVD